MSKIIGIDPGKTNGIAYFSGGKLVDLLSVDVIDVFGTIKDLSPAMIVFEDSRLTSHLFSAKSNYASNLKIARNVGQVDAVCSLIDQIAERLKITAHGISPKNKGAKLDAERFKKATGWDKPSNQHTRDAAMVAWRYRAGI